MNRPLLLGLSCAALLAVGTAQAERLWLVIGASDASPTGIARKAQPLTPQFPNALVVRTTDCGEARPMLAWASDALSSSAAAQVSLKALRAVVKDAYVKRCEAKPGSLLSLRFSAVDPSIAQVPSGQVNWDDDDGLSSVAYAAKDYTIVISRQFVPSSASPLGGKRESVVKVSADGRRTLMENCLEPREFTTNGGRLAWQCVTEQAADHLLHQVVVFDSAGSRLADLPRCRKPSWTTTRTLTCTGESVDATGALQLRPQQHDLAP